MLYRSLKKLEGIDFYSNDYLGMSSEEVSFSKSLKTGATGARLISGNTLLYEEFEGKIASHFQSESALLFNSGYDANLGLFSSIPKRGDTVIYDEYIHASIRDGIRLSLSNSLKFKHNNFKELEEKLKLARGNKFVVVEALYSMDGDTPDLKSLAQICNKNSAYLIVDEAHSVGIEGLEGRGACYDLDILESIFARIITFGKAFGAHGAAILTSNTVTEYLINFSRPFIYTTAISEHNIDIISQKFLKTIKKTKRVNKLNENISIYLEKTDGINNFSQNNSPIQYFSCNSNEKALALEKFLLNNGFLCKAILSPTVPKNAERIRISLHSFNTTSQIDSLISNIILFCKQNLT